MNKITKNEYVSTLKKSKNTVHRLMEVSEMQSDVDDAWIAFIRLKGELKATAATIDAALKGEK